MTPEQARKMAAETCYGSGSHTEAVRHWIKTGVAVHGGMTIGASVADLILRVHTEAAAEERAAVVAWAKDCAHEMMGQPGLEIEAEEWVCMVKGIKNGEHRKEPI